MKKQVFFLVQSFFLVSIVFGQNEQVFRIKEYCIRNKAGIINEFSNFLSIPNVGKDTANISKNAAFIMQMMNKRDIQNVQLLHAASAGVPPTVFGEVSIKGAVETLIFYAHYDGQPINAVNWAKGLEPFKPKMFTDAIDKGGSNVPFGIGNEKYDNNWRIYGRSASDDKAGVDAILNAYDAISKSGLLPTCNIKFFFEGEEEAGSTHLSEILEKYRGLLQSSLWIICDGPVHQSGKKQIVFGVRGDAHLDLTVYASKRPLHSGHYGNWAPNPALMLAKLLASMKDEDGKVTVKGFYDDVTPLTPLEIKALKEVPSVDEQMKSELGISLTERPDLNLSEAINQPSLNINGMHSGNVGKLAANVIPTSATSVIDLRLVLGNDWRRQQQKVTDHIKAQGYFVTDKEPTDNMREKYGKIIKVIVGDDGYNAQRTQMDLPIIKKVIDAVKATTKEQLVLQPTSGGSLPLFLFEKYLNAKTITIPIANHDNNQHAENENLRLQNLWDGIETMASLMMMK